MKIVPRKYKSDKMKLENLYARGEGRGPDGFCAETVNGTAHWKGTGWNQVPEYWNTSPQVEPQPTRPAGRSNRTGE
jgi:hypothetical protein